MTKHLIIPDTQVKYGLDFSYLRRIGQYIIDKKPDVVVHLGDFADMESLSSYDIGKKSFEGKRSSGKILNLAGTCCHDEHNSIHRIYNRMD